MKLKQKTAIAAGIAALAVGIGSQAAFATTTLAVDGTTSPAGPVTISGVATTSLEFETNFGVKNTCLTGSSGGTVLRGISGPIGTQVGTISSMGFGSCTATKLLFKVNAFKKATPANWTIHLAEVPAKGASSVKVEIRGIEAQLQDDVPNPGPPPAYLCALNVTGTVKATITTGANSQIVIDTPALSGGLSNTNPLVIDALPTNLAKPNTQASSCGGEVWDGDVASMKGTFLLDHDITVS